MAAHPYTLVDLAASLAAVVIYPLFVLIPGYVVAWLLDLFEFRRRTQAFRLALSIPLSIALVPIAVYLVGRFCPMDAVWVLFAAFWTDFALLAVRGKLGFPRAPKAAFAIVFLWLAVALAASVDLQFGAKAYYPVSAFDYSVRAEFIQAIGRTGIPPATPFYFAGHLVPLRYHYFWLLVCSLVERAGFGWIDARQAWIGGVFWSGLGLISLAAVYCRMFWYRGAASFSRRAVTGILLLAVTGLDILPTAVLWIFRAMGNKHAILLSVEWWNEQVDGFAYTALWEAHHLAGLLCCLMAFLLIGEAARQTATRRLAVQAIAAGLALASAVGASIHIAFVFAVFLTVWAVIALAKKWWREIAVLAIAGAVALLLAFPYALTLRNATGAAAAGGPPLELWMRPFHPVDNLFRGQGITTAWKLILVNALMLPLNYYLELGFFFAAALAWWRMRDRRLALSRSEWAVAAMVASSVIVCTFVRSSLIGNNDLGWRGFLIAQFGLLLWAVDVMEWSPRLEQGARRYLTALLVLGAAGTVYDVALLRTYPIMADAGWVAHISWMAPDGRLGLRNYAAREAYEWAATHSSPVAVEQFDPHVALQDTSGLLYASRQIAAASDTCIGPFGSDPGRCAATVAELGLIYPRPGEPVPPSTAGVCGSLPIDLLVAKDTDPAWADPNGWVWREKPVFANEYFRIFDCAGARSAVR